jgi:hypothetical protein
MLVAAVVGAIVVAVAQEELAVEAVEAMGVTALLLPRLGQLIWAAAGAAVDIT